MRDASALARLIYELAGAEAAYPPLSTTLAEMALGPGSVRAARQGTLPSGVKGRLIELPRPRARGGMWPGSARWRIEVGRKMFDGERLLELLALVAHELAEWGAGQVERYRGADIENYADETGLLLRAPRAAVRRLCKDAGGPDYEAVAEDLLITEVEAAARVAEALEIPTLIMASGYFWEAGPVYSWPDDLELLSHHVGYGKLPRHVELVKIEGATVLRAVDRG